jgi:hypothetical protein
VIVAGATVIAGAVTLVTDDVVGIRVSYVAVDRILAVASVVDVKEVVLG